MCSHSSPVATVTGTNARLCDISTKISEIRDFESGINSARRFNTASGSVACSRIISIVYTWRLRAKVFPERSYIIPLDGGCRRILILFSSANNLNLSDSFTPSWFIRQARVAVTPNCIPANNKARLLKSLGVLTGSFMFYSL